MKGKYLLKTALFGLLISFLLSAILTDTADSIVVSWRGNSFYTDIFSLFGLWLGFLGTCIYSLRYRPIEVVQSEVSYLASGVKGKESAGSHKTGFYQGKSVLSKLSDNYGFKVKPLLDIPFGVLVGVITQLYLVSLFSWPLSFFVHNLSHKISEPANTLVHNLSHTEIIVLGILICVMSPLFEELFFRGLLQRAFLDTSAPFGHVYSAVFSIVLTAAVFATAHFELLQFVPLFCFGIILGLSAYFTRRLGLGFVAHVSFNTVAYVAIARGHF